VTAAECDEPHSEVPSTLRGESSPLLRHGTRTPVDPHAAVGIEEDIRHVFFAHDPRERAELGERNSSGDVRSPSDEGGHADILNVTNGDVGPESTAC
jgi:hypothetical protein